MRYSKVLMIVSNRFLKFLHNLFFRGQGIHCWHSLGATSFGWPRKSGSTSGSRTTQKYWWLCLMDFPNIFNIYVSKVKNHLLTYLLSCHAWRTSKIQNNFRFWRFSRSPIGSSSCTEGCAGYSKSPKHGILVGMLALNCLTPETWILRSFWTGSWPGFLRLPRHGSSEGMSEMNSSTSKK
jgi:hypothetical protein